MKNKKMTAGFTLVELIVVIAILGILAGVGTVGYSGYIKKANMAADQQLVAVLNQAFSAACIENGMDQKSITDAEAPVTDKKVTTVDVKAGAPDAVMTKIEAAFVKYFGEEGATFKMIEELEYSKYLGFYSDLLAGSHSYEFAGNTVTISAADKAILSGDNAFTDMGADPLLNEVGTLERLIGLGAGEEILGEIGASGDFVNAFAGYLGLKMEDYENEDAYWAAYEAKLEELDSTNPNATTNAMVMYAASHAANATDTQISKLFTYVENQALTSRIEGDTEAETMTNAALAYGMYIAYAERNNIDTTDVSNFSNTVTTKEFAEYFASADGQADLEAYQAAMRMIGDNTSNTEITSSILANGIVNNSDLSELMKKVMGN